MQYVVSMSVAVVIETDSREKAQRDAERSIWSVPGVDYTSVNYVQPLGEPEPECSECLGECEECQ